MRGALVAGIFLFLSFAFLHAADAQSTPTLSVSPLTGLPEDTYTFKVAGISSSVAYIEARMTLQFYEKVSGDWKNLAIFEDVIQQSSADFQTSLDDFTVDGTSIISKYTKVNVDEQFRVLVDRQTNSGTAENNERSTNSVPIRFAALCVRSAPTLQITEPADRMLKVPVKSSDQTIQYSVSLKNNDPAKCGPSQFSINKAFVIESDGEEGRVGAVTSNSESMILSPGETKTMIFNLKIEGDIDEDTGFNIVATNQKSKGLGETNPPSSSARLTVDMVEEEILECKKEPKISLARQSSSGTVAPNFPTKFTATIENQNDGGVRNYRL